VVFLDKLLTRSAVGLNASCKENLVNVQNVLEPVKEKTIKLRKAAGCNSLMDTQ